MYEDCRKHIIRKAMPKTRHVRQFRNPGPDTYRKRGQVRTRREPEVVATSH